MTSFLCLEWAQRDLKSDLKLAAGITAIFEIDACLLALGEAPVH
jgi:hypothetical protein